MNHSPSSSSPQDRNTGARIVGNKENLSGPGPEVMAASTLKGEKVVNLHSENLGEIEDIMLDVPSGRIAYAVLSFGGVMGVGDKLFAIPWDMLTLDTNRKCFVLNIDKEQLKNAPGFDKDHWPSMADPTWTASVHSNYSHTTYRE